VDGRESKPYNGIKVGLLAFSPDSRRLAYGAQGDKGWVVVLDGQAGKSYEKVLADMERDFWLNAAEAVDYGIVSRIIESSRELS